MKHLKKALTSVSSGVVATSKWLKDNGISNELQQVYKKSGWLSSIGHGAYLKLNEKPTFEGALYALQKQLGLKLHIGGKSALVLKYGVSQYVPFNKQYELFAENVLNVPRWFKSHFHGDYTLRFVNFIPYDVGLVEFDEGGYSITISTPERAFLEMLYNVPKYASVDEAYQLLELLPSLRPSILQELLYQSKSIKVNRVFFYLADKLRHAWFEQLDQTKVNFGSGVRLIDKDGIYDKKTNLIIHKVGDE